MKKKIEELMLDGNIEEAERTLKCYEENIKEKCLKDAEINDYKCMIMLYIGDYEKAKFYGAKAVKDMPYVADVRYNYAVACKQCQKWFDAYEQYGIALEFAKYGNPYGFDKKVLEAEMAEILEYISKDLESGNAELLKKKKNSLDYLVLQENLEWSVAYPLFLSDYSICETDYRDYVETAELYVAYAANAQNEHKLKMNLLKKDCVEAKIELQRMQKIETEVVIQRETEYFLPIVMDEAALFIVKRDDKQMAVPYIQKKQIVNYRMPSGKSTIISNCPYRIGEIIPIEHKKSRKKLVLNIFVDGLSQVILNETFADHMPYTYRFFSKGLCCKNTYTAGDWTYPSIASIVTGQTMAQHKMLHSKLLRKIDINTPLLFEYFKNAGYNTTKIGGNWRITPNYGYARGMNRVLYQHHYIGYAAEEIVSDVEEQIDSMRETDQFIWMEIGELHQIADKINIGQYMKELPVEEVQWNTDGINSVKQGYDEAKIKYYLSQVKRVDRKLKTLYQYIEDNYSDDEILVSLFSDHGQSYLIKLEEEFLSKPRSNVAFMVRGNHLQGETEEIISMCDYSAIMCKLAGIPYKYEDTEAHLPQIFGGESQREFAITESIHVGDPYQISLKGRDVIFYLKGKDDVTSECRVPLDDYEVSMTDLNGNKIEDKEKVSYYTNYCLEHVAACRVFD